VEQRSRFEQEDRILQSVRRRNGVVTAGDVAADTGLPLAEAEILMRELLSRYKSHLDVDDDGNLCYRFDPQLVRRGEQPSGRTWYEIKRWLWSAARMVFKIGITLTLVGYSVFFIVALLALSVAGVGALLGNDSDSDGLGELLFIPFRLLLWMLDWLFWIDLGRSMGRGAYDPGYGQVKKSKTGHKKIDKPIYQKITDFAFGPEDTSDPMAAYQAFTAFVRARDGRVSAAEWSMRTGQSLEAAESALTASIMRFQGDVQVSDDGQLVYTFDELRLTAGAQPAQPPHQEPARFPQQDYARSGGMGGMGGMGGRRGYASGPQQHYPTQQAAPARAAGVEPPPIWTVEAKQPSLTGNEGNTNIWISLFNAFNLFMSMVAMIGGLSMGADGALVALAGVIPFIFSGLFFFIPMLRLIARSFSGVDIHKENARRQAIKLIYESVQGGLARPIPLQRLPSHLSTDLIRDFDGDLRTDERGQAVVVFETLAAQLDAAAQARRMPRQAATQFGQTVFSSDDERFDQERADLDDFDRRLALDLGGSESMFAFAPQQATQRAG
jgi:hypothetical protein